MSMDEELGFDDPTLIRHMSDEDIKRTVDGLVEAWEDHQAALDEHDAFQRNHIEPEPPATVIESVESLIEYDRQKWRYDERLEAINDKLEKHNTELQVKSSMVKLLLPLSHILVHDYRGQRSDLQGNTYAIRHELPEGGRRPPTYAIRRELPSVINISRRTGPPGN